jgi:hypothetical protein
MLDGGYCRSAAGGRRFENQDGPSRWRWQDLDKVRRFVTAAKLTTSRQ